MDKVILIWYVDDYHEMGGGLAYEIFDSISNAQDKINELIIDKRISIEEIFETKREFVAKPVEIIKKYQIEEA